MSDKNKTFKSVSFCRMCTPCVTSGATTRLEIVRQVFVQSDAFEMRDNSLSVNLTRLCFNIFDFNLRETDTLLLTCADGDFNFNSSRSNASLTRKKNLWMATTEFLVKHYQADTLRMKNVSFIKKASIIAESQSSESILALEEVRRLGFFWITLQIFGQILWPTFLRI